MNIPNKFVDTDAQIKGIMENCRNMLNYKYTEICAQIDTTVSNSVPADLPLRKSGYAQRIHNAAFRHIVSINFTTDFAYAL